MNSKERALLEGFLDKLVQVHGTRKIPQADAMIRRAVERQPDAAYLLVQRSLMLEQALEQSNARIDELELTQRQPDQNFLDTGTSSNPRQMQRTAAMMAPAPSAGAAPSEPSRGGGAASFLGQAAATAAGVAGGAFLFEGIENLFGPHGANLPGQAAQSFIPEETINNYYSSDGQHAHASDEPDRFTDDDDAAESGSDSGNDDGDFV
jgi:uncharacterized protein